MSDNKYGLLFSRDVVEKFRGTLTKEQFGDVFLAVFDHFDGVEPQFENNCLYYFYNELCKLPERYVTPDKTEKIDKRKSTSPENGKKGGRPKKRVEPSPEDLRPATLENL